MSKDAQHVQNETGVTELAGRVVRARTRVGLTQRELSRRSGVSQSTLSRIESGDREASHVELVAIADACGALLVELTGASRLREDVRVAGRGSIEPLIDGLAPYLALSESLDGFGLDLDAVPA